MRCKSCDYSLWNLTARQCPECGAGFKPSDFEFTFNSVQFRCPHCSQPYYGTGAKGHLVPAAFTCVSCNTPVQMDEMVLLPTEGVAEEHTKADEMPWLVRGKIGFFRGFFGTIGHSMVAPAPLIRMTPVNSSAWAAFFYALIVTTTVVLLSIGLVIGLAVFGVLLGTGGGRSIVPAVASFGGTLLAIAASLTLFVVVWTVAVHLSLKISGPTQAGFGRTLQVICYSSGCNIISAIPCFGIYVIPLGMLWWMIAAIFMLRDGQRVSALRASISILWLPIVIGGVSVGLALWGFTTMQRFQAQIQAQSQTQAAADAAAAQARADPLSTGATDCGPQVSTIAAVIAAHTAETGRFPDHALELCTRGGITLAGFVVTPPDESGIRDTSGYRFGGVPFEEIAMMSNDRVRGMAKSAAAGNTDAAGTHRLGDFVFFWKGIDPSAPVPGLWVLVLVPEAPTPAGWWVGFADGSSEFVTGADFNEAFEAQNMLREKHTLPPIPDPRLVPADAL